MILKEWYTTNNIIMVLGYKNIYMGSFSFIMDFKFKPGDKKYG
jgi:hypothetical protein